MNDWSVEKAPYTESVVNANRNEWIVGQSRGFNDAA